MEVLDNKEYILGQIKRQADRQEQKLEKAFQDQLADIRKEIAEKTKQTLAEMKVEHKKRLEKLSRQQESALDLLKHQKTLEKQSALHRQVHERLTTILSGSEKAAICSLMIERLKKSGRDITSFRVPKGVSLPNCEAVNVEFVVTGVVTKNEELEIRLEDLLHEQHASVHAIIAKELFK